MALGAANDMAEGSGVIFIAGAGVRAGLGVGVGVGRREDDEEPTASIEDEEPPVS